MIGRLDMMRFQYRSLERFGDTLLSSSFILRDVINMMLAIFVTTALACSHYCNHVMFPNVN